MAIAYPDNKLRPLTSDWTDFGYAYIIRKRATRMLALLPKDLVAKLNMLMHLDKRLIMQLAVFDNVLNWTSRMSSGTSFFLPSPL